MSQGLISKVSVCIVVANFKILGLSEGKTSTKDAIITW